MRLSRELEVAILIVIMIIAISAIYYGRMRSEHSNRKQIVLTGPYIEVRYPGKVRTGIDLDKDGNYEYIIDTNPWDIRSASGSAVMRFYITSKAVVYEQDLKDIKLRGDYVHGYPEIYYGNKPWGGIKALDGPVPLPERVRDLNDFYITLNYTIEHDSALPINLAVESWFTSEKFRTTGVYEGEIEMMIWFYWSSLSPAGSKIDEIVVPITVNGKAINAKFEVYLSKASNKWTYVAFKLTKPIKEGCVKFDYAPFIRKLKDLIPPEHLGSLYLEDIEVGTEYGSPYITEARLKWIIYEFKLEYTNKSLFG